MKTNFLPPVVAMLLAAALMAAPLQAEGEAPGAPRFFETLPDLPVMEGLAELEDIATMFDTPGGRIVEVYAAGDVAERLIADFYAATLPQLGWMPSPAVDGQMRFERDGENLVMEFADERVANHNGGAWSVRFSIAPL